MKVKLLLLFFKLFLSMKDVKNAYASIIFLSQLYLTALIFF
jgi:hypothetical protein